MLDWSGTWLPGRGLSARRRRQRSPTSIGRHSDERSVPRAARLTSSATDASQLPDHTAMELAANQDLDGVTVWNNSSVGWRHSCLVPEATAPCDICLKVRCVLTYLLITYLLRVLPPVWWHWITNTSVKALRFYTMLDFWRSDGHPQAKWGHFPSCKCKRLQILFSYNVLVRTKKRNRCQQTRFMGSKFT